MSDDEGPPGGAIGGFLRSLKKIEPVIVFGPMLGILVVIATATGQRSKFREEENYWVSIITVLFVFGFVYISFVVDRLARRRGGIFSAEPEVQDSLGGLEPTLVDQAPAGGPIGLVIHYPISSIMLVLLTVASYFALRSFCKGCGGGKRETTTTTQSYTRTNGRGDSYTDDTPQTPMQQQRNGPAHTPEAMAQRWMTQGVDKRKIPPAFPAIPWEEKKRKKKRSRGEKTRSPQRRREDGPPPPQVSQREAEEPEQRQAQESSRSKQRPPPQLPRHQQREEVDAYEDEEECFDAADDGRGAGDVNFPDRLQDVYYEDYFEQDPDQEQPKNSAAARTRQRQCSFSFKDCFDGVRASKAQPAPSAARCFDGDYNNGDLEQRMRRQRRRNPALRDPAPYPASHKFYSSAGAGAGRRLRAAAPLFASAAAKRAKVCPQHRAPSAPSRRKSYNLVDNNCDDGRDYASDPGYEYDDYAADLNTMTTRPSFTRTGVNWNVETTVNDNNSEQPSFTTYQTEQEAEDPDDIYLEQYEHRRGNVANSRRHGGSPPRSPPPKRGRLNNTELKRLQNNPRAPTRVELNNRRTFRRPASRKDAPFQAQQVGDHRLPRNRGYQKAIHSALQRQDLSSIHRILQQAPMRSPQTIHNRNKVQLPRQPSGNYRPPREPYDFSLAQDVLQEAAGYDTTGGTQTENIDAGYDQQYQQRHQQQARRPLIVANKKPLSNKVRRQVEQRIKAQHRNRNRDRQHHRHDNHVVEG